MFRKVIIYKDKYIINIIINVIVITRGVFHFILNILPEVNMPTGIWLHMDFTNSVRMDFMYCI